MNRVTRDDIKPLIEKGEEIRINILTKEVTNIITYDDAKDGSRKRLEIVKDRWVMDDDQLLLLIVEYGKHANFRFDDVIIRKHKPVDIKTFDNQRLSGGDIVQLKNKMIIEIADIRNGYIISPVHERFSCDDVIEVIKKWHER